MHTTNDHTHEQTDMHSDATQAEQSTLAETLAQATAENAKLREQLLYTRAEYDNFRRRTDREKANWSDDARLGVARDLLELIDDVERALEDAGKRGLDETTNQALTMIYKSALKMLQKYAIKAIEVGSEFDPHLHESLMQVPAENKASGEVVAVLQKGYMMGTKLLRPARVTVAQ